VGSLRIGHQRQFRREGRIFLIFCLLTYDVTSAALACRLALTCASAGCC